jgi:hypothetical protein
MNCTVDKEAPFGNKLHSMGDVLDCGQIKCPHPGCDSMYTHVMDVVWERDPHEGDRRWVRMEVRCEERGHGFLLFIRNHGGVSRMEYQLLENEVSPFSEGGRW